MNRINNGTRILYPARNCWAIIEPAMYFWFGQKLLRILYTPIPPVCNSITAHESAEVGGKKKTKIIMSLEKKYCYSPNKNPRFISFAGARESPWYTGLKKKKKITSVNYVKLCQQQQKEKATRLYTSPRRLQLVIIRVWFSDIFTQPGRCVHVDMQILCCRDQGFRLYNASSRLSTICIFWI